MQTVFIDLGFPIFAMRLRNTKKNYKKLSFQMCSFHSQIEILAKIVHLLIFNILQHRKTREYEINGFQFAKKYA